MKINFFSRLFNNTKNNFYYKVYKNENITNEMLKEVLNLDKKFFKEEYLWDTDYQIKIFNKNKNSFIIIKYKNKLIGYLNYLVITEEKYNEMLNSNVIVDEFELNEILPFNENNSNYLTINSVVIDKEFQNGIAVRLLTSELQNILSEMNLNNYKIVGINGFAVSNDGMHFLENLGFEKIRLLEDNNNLYVLSGEKLDKYLKKVK